METKSRNLTLPFAAIQFFYWTGFAAILAFTGVYLLKTGLTNGEIGIVIALGGSAAALGQPLFSAFADKDKAPSVKRLLLAICLVTVICAVLLLATGLSAVNTGSKVSTVLNGVFYGSAIMLLQLMQPFVNALGMESINQGHRLDFGFTKAFGSGGYAAAAYLLGVLAEKISAHVIPIFICCTFVVLMVLLLFFPFQKVPKEHTRKENSGTSGGFFGQYKRFMWVVAGLFCIYTGHTIINNFILQIITPLGGGSAQMGTAAAICAIVELPILFLFTPLSKKAGGDLLVRISGVFFTLKILFSLLAPTMQAYYLVQIFQIGGWGLMSVALVYYVNSVMQPEDAVKGQGFAAMAFTVGSVAGALLGGWLLDSAGVNVLMIVGTVISGIGSGIILIFARKIAG